LAPSSELPAAGTFTVVLEARDAVGAEVRQQLALQVKP
jgi:hypothetical protein